MDSGILNEAIKYRKATKENATHFVLCNGDKIRYFIELNKGRKYLSQNLSSYSKKLFILLNLLNFIPFELMKIFKMGYFVQASFNEEIRTFIEKTTQSGYLWNVIVGTYDRKQKIVIQLWNTGSTESKYYKVGNSLSNKEMINEMNFLNNYINYKRLFIPKIINSQRIECGNNFNIQLTEGFKGKKVDPVLTQEIYGIFEEIVNSREIIIKDGIKYGFSHGDFAPWNIKSLDKGYMVFDWEHCGIRFYGFDLIHYIFQIEYLLNGKEKNEAFKLALCKAIKIDKGIEFINIKELYFKEYNKIH